MNPKNEDKNPSRDSETRIDKNFPDILEKLRKSGKERRLRMLEQEKKEFREKIDLESEIKQWYSKREIKIGMEILENIFNNFHKLKTLNEKGLVAAIDYALTEIFSKKGTQKEIAKRHNTSTATLIKGRYLIADSIPLEYFYPLFISESDPKSGKEKTFIFKASRAYNRRNYSKFDLKESNTLEGLHYAIHRFLDWEDFYDDHLYSFFMSGKEWDSSTEYAGPPKYQSDRGLNPTNIQLKKIHLGYKQRFLYLYDYGDCNKYTVTIVGLGVYDEEKEYPFQIN